MRALAATLPSRAPQNRVEARQRPKLACCTPRVPQQHRFTPVPGLCAPKSGSRRARAAMASTPSATAESVAAAALSSLASSPAISIVAALGAAGLLACVWAWWDAAAKRAPPSIYIPAAASEEQAQTHRRVIGRCPTLLADYKPVPFLTNRHGAQMMAAMVAAIFVLLPNRLACSTAVHAM